jgi:hypothetical protein
MMDANAFLRRMLLLAVVSALPMVNVAYAHSGGGKGTGGSSGGGSAGGGSSSGSGHSASSTSGGHSATSTTNGHSATAPGHAATASKGSRVANNDPVSISQSANQPSQHVRVFRIFQQAPSTGYTTQYRETNNEEWRRKHQRLFLGFIRY